jgi:hypothetical protein
MTIHHHQRERDLIRLAKYFVTEAYRAYFNPDLPTGQAVNDLQAAALLINEMLVGKPN